MHTHSRIEKKKTLEKAAFVSIPCHSSITPRTAQNTFCSPILPQRGQYACTSCCVASTTLVHQNIVNRIRCSALAICGFMSKNHPPKRANQLTISLNSLLKTLYTPNIPSIATAYQQSSSVSRDVCFSASAKFPGPNARAIPFSVLVTCTQYQTTSGFLRDMLTLERCLCADLVLRS